MQPQQIRKLAATLLTAVAVTGAAAPASSHTLSTYGSELSHVAARARSELGAPYRSGGSSPSGFDCSGFTRWVFAGHGASLPHSSAGQFALGERGGYERIYDRHALEPGDLVFFDTTSAGVGHVGIYLGNGRFISATTSSGIHVDSVYDPYYWGPRWVGATRLPVMNRDEAGRGGAHPHQLI